MSSHDEHCLEAGGLRARFYFERDRFAHEIWVADGAQWRRVLASIEGTPDDAWPASPPLQSFHRELRDARQVALLVGMAGKSHWSASIELDPAAASLTFDIACRAAAAPSGQLGSHYTTDQGARPLDPRTLEWTHGSAIWRIASCADWGADRIDLDPPTISIRPAADHPAGRHTVRWGYQLSRVTRP